ncbi:MAG: hypothetical protein ACOY71_01840 [Gemmatimonadota bacterium]
MPNRIALLIPGHDARAAVERELQGLAAPHVCETMSGLAELAERRPPLRAVVTAARDRNGTAVMPALILLRERLPRLPFVLVGPPSGDALDEVQHLVSDQPHLGLEFAADEAGDLAHVLRIALQPTYIPSAAGVLAHRLVPLVAPLARPLVALGALKALPKLDVGTAAAWLRVPAKTLYGHISGARLGSPKPVLGRLAALHAVWWLERGWTAQQVASAMGFALPGTVGDLVRDYAGGSVRDYRAPGSFYALLDQAAETFRWQTGDHLSSG